MRLCKNCYFGGNETCARITGLQINQESQACPLYLHRDSVKICDCCRRAIIDTVIYDEDKALCEDCSSKYNTCATCRRSLQCAFETDPSPIPPVIMKQTRNGNMVMQSQVMNPERIAITCAKGCLCFDTATQSCKRQTQGFCNTSNYSCAWRTE